MAAMRGDELRVSLADRAMTLVLPEVRIFPFIQSAGRQDPERRLMLITRKRFREPNRERSEKQKRARS